jgi:hypothetical protein
MGTYDPVRNPLLSPDAGSFLVSESFVGKKDGVVQPDPWVLIRYLSLPGCSIRTRSFEKWRPTRYLCTLCNYVYDENRVGTTP